MTAEDKALEIRHLCDMAEIAAPCEPTGCNHDYKDRPCPVQYVRRISTVIYFDGETNQLPWYR